MYIQIIWFRKGHGVHHVGFIDYPVSDETIFFVAPGQVHAFDGGSVLLREVLQANDGQDAQEI